MEMLEKIVNITEASLMKDTKNLVKKKGFIRITLF